MKVVLSALLVLSTIGITDRNIAKNNDENKLIPVATSPKDRPPVILEIRESTKIFLDNVQIEKMPESTGSNIQIEVIKRGPGNNVSEIRLITVK